MSLPERQHNTVSTIDSAFLILNSIFGADACHFLLLYYHKWLLYPPLSCWQVLQPKCLNDTPFWPRAIIEPTGLCSWVTAHEWRGIAGTCTLFAAMLLKLAAAVRCRETECWANLLPDRELVWSLSACVEVVSVAALSMVIDHDLSQCGCPPSRGGFFLISCFLA